MSDHDDQSKSKAKARDGYQIQEIFAAIKEDTLEAIKQMPEKGYKTRSQLVKECPKQISHILDKMQLGIKGLELFIEHLSSEQHIQRIETKIENHRECSAKADQELFNKIVVPYVYNHPKDSQGNQISSTFLSGTQINMTVCNYILGNRKYPLTIQDRCENDNNLLKSKRSYEFLLKRKMLSLKLPSTAKSVQVNGTFINIHFKDFCFVFESQPTTLLRNKQQDLLLLYSRTQLSRNIKQHEEKINQIMSQKIDFLLSAETEKYFIKYLEQLFLRVRLGYFYLERMYQYIQQNKQYFIDVKYQQNNMMLKFYFSKQFEYMNEIMGENGQYQIEFVVNKLSFNQFLDLITKKDQQNSYKNDQETVGILNQISREIQSKESQDKQQITQEDKGGYNTFSIHVYGSRFNNLTSHEIKLPNEISMKEDISTILKYIEQSVYSFSQSQTAFANYNFKLFSKAYYKLIQKYPILKIQQQGSADCVLFPCCSLKARYFSKKNPIFYSLDNQQIEKQHEEYNENSDSSEEHVEDMVDEETKRNNKNDEINENEIVIHIVSQMYIFKNDRKMIIKNIKGENVYEIQQFKRKHLSKASLNLIAFTMLKHLITVQLQFQQYSLIKFVDSQYYYASKYILKNNNTRQMQIFRVNLDFSDPSSISMLFIVTNMDEDDHNNNNINTNNKLIEEFQFSDLIQRFSYSEKISKKEKMFLRSMKQMKNNQEMGKYLETVNKNVTYNRLTRIFENFIHYTKQQISDETFMYRDALKRTFRIKDIDLQIQTKLEKQQQDGMLEN